MPTLPQPPAPGQIVPGQIVHVAGPPAPVGDPALPHVLLAVDELARTLGGGERVLMRLARELPRYGFRVSVLTLSLHPESPALADPPCPVYLLPLRRTYDLTALRAALALRRFLQQQGIVLVQTFFESSDLWVGPVAKTVAGIRLIWSRRDLGILRGQKHQVAYRLLRRLPDRVFAVSDEVREHILRVDGVPANRVVTVHNGIDLAEAAPARVPTAEPARLHITAVGNLRPVKGFDVLVEAAAEVVQHVPEAHFTVAGEVLDPAYAASLQRRVEELGLAAHFRWLGNVAAVREHLATADVFCLPSRSEGLSNALLEAMAAGLPAVATTVGGNPECVEDEVSGLLVPPDSVAALSAALLRLAGDPALRQRLGTAARARALDKFSTDAMLRVTKQLYLAVLGGASSREPASVPTK